MKKTIILLLLILITKEVYALETNIRKEDISIKYKWYHEIITDEMFYPKKDNLEDYLENPFKIEYGNYTEWDSKYCSYSTNNYVVETKVKNTYKIIGSTRYIKFSNVSNEEINKINIFSEKYVVNFEIIKENEEGITIKLDNIYTTYNLWFYIDLDKEYTMTLSYNEDFSTETLTKTITGKKLLIPDYTWITPKTNYVIIITESQLASNAFLTAQSSQTVCRIKEIKTYRYKLTREYYNDNYYEYVDNYIPDTEDYIVEYHGKNQIDLSEVVEQLKKDIQEKEKIISQNERFSPLNIIQNNQSESKTDKVISNDNVPYITTTNIIEKENNKSTILKDKFPYIVIFILAINLFISSAINILIIKSRIK